MRSNGSLWRSLLLLLVGSAVTGALAGCGGGAGAGGGGGTTTTTTTTTTAVAPAGGTTSTAGSIQLTVSSTNLQSSGVTPIDITVRVLSTTSVVIAGKCVTFTITDVAPVAFITDVSNGGVTDTNGIVTARLNLGTNKANRTITLTANAVNCTTGGTEATATTTITVVGTTATITSNPSVTFGGQTDVTVTVRDAAGNAIPGATVTVISASGNTLTPSTGTTNAFGQFVTTVTGTVAGVDTITATALGAPVTPFTFTVSSTNFRFVAPTPAEGARIAIGAVPTVLTVQWNEAAPTVPGPAVAFSATRGTIVGSPDPVDLAPIPEACPAGAICRTATVTITSTSAGPTTITARDSFDGVPSTTRTLVFVATSANCPCRVDVQATPSTVAANVVGSSANTSTITAVVRDSTDNLVEGARVNFVLDSDPTAGALSASSAVSDASGVASVSYIAGTVTCCGGAGTPSAVVVRATVAEIPAVAGGPPVALGAPLPTDTVTLTVGGQALFVRLGTNNLLGADLLNYIKSYSALVTDAGGNPVRDAEVVFTVRPAAPPAVAFIKGIRVFCLQDTGLPFTIAVPTNPAACGPLGTTLFTAWKAVPRVFCPSEDRNFNGILDVLPAPPEDTNADGLLTPGNVASVNTSAVTDSAGFALATITYSKQYGDWTTVTLVATARVSGTESTSQATFILPVLRSDVDDATDSPPGVNDPIVGDLRSPFGRGAVVTSVNPLVEAVEASPAGCATTN